MIKTFLENRYAKDKKDTNETKHSIARVELEMDRLINSIANYVPPPTDKMSKTDKQNFEIHLAALQQAQVYFRKSLRELRKGARYLR